SCVLTEDFALDAVPIEGARIFDHGVGAAALAKFQLECVQFAFRSGELPVDFGLTRCLRAGAEQLALRLSDPIQDLFLTPPLSGGKSLAKIDARFREPFDQAA